MSTFYTDRFLFIHIPKCGGTAIANVARNELPGAVFPGVRRKDHRPGLCIGHIRARDIERFTGRPLDSFETIIAPVREPHDLEVSRYTFHAWRHYKDGPRVSWRFPMDEYCRRHTFKQYVCGGFDPFCEWYERAILQRPEHAPAEWRGVDRLRYFLGVGDDWELPPNYRPTFAEHPEVTAGYLGLPEPPRVNATPLRKSTDSYYDDESRAAIRELYPWGSEIYAAKAVDGLAQLTALSQEMGLYDG